MRKIKCSQCGGTEFYEGDRSLFQDQWVSVMAYCGDCGTCDPTIDVYICKNCGHIELFVRDDYKKKYEDSLRKAQEYNKRKE